jgi:hypothetical protein
MAFLLVGAEQRRVLTTTHHRVVCRRSGGWFHDVVSEVQDRVGSFSAVPYSRAAADVLAARLLGGLRTKLGGLHIEHARRVADRVRPSGDDRTVAAALLHDVVEKERISLADLLALVRDERLVELVDILTRREVESDEEYLARCAADPVALAIKRADLADKDYYGDAQVDLRTATQLSHKAHMHLMLLDRLVEAAGPGSMVQPSAGERANPTDDHETPGTLLNVLPRSGGSE